MPRDDVAEIALRSLRKPLQGRTLVPTQSAM